VTIEAERPTDRLDRPAPRPRPRIPIERVPQPREDKMSETWRLARPSRIGASLELAQGRSAGGWFVAGLSGDVGRTESVTRTVAGREVVLWRDERGDLVAGPGSCPHLGALMDRCPVIDGTMYCRWHGLALTREGDRTWSPYRAHDDGVLLWVGLPTAAEPGVCEPQDVIANRLDPWHGAWFHPYAFSHLVVDDEASTPGCLVVDVTFRINKTWGVPVRAEFTCPDSRTIVMTITDGEGAGSVVETHATPLGLDGEGRPLTMITEATIAYSDRKGFKIASWLSPALVPMIKRTARQLWVDDRAYAERRYELRRRGEYPG
jgi:nitrite reductase/ring-hydroxylating ferredoxin subunit